jgi:DNA-directed RNA polymerase subunit RPC12/RpoP
MREGPGSTLTLDQAYQAAYLWMFHIGEPPTDIAERGPQAVELRSTGITSFVRVPDKPVGQRTVLAILASEPDDRTRTIFSASGFTPAAVSIAEAQGIALFSLGPDGRAYPRNGRASIIAPADEPPAPFTMPVVEDDLTMAFENWGKTEFQSDEWIDCPECGTNQHHSLDNCRVCGAPLQKNTSLGSPPDGVVYRCRECGSHDIEIVAANDPAKHA